MTEIWKQEKVVNWCQTILNSYEQIVGKQLIPRNGDKIEESKALFFAPFVVVSHGTETNPIFNFANKIALNLWEMNWEEFTKIPSKKPVIPDNIETREKLLQEVTTKGYVDNYYGVRISKSGKHFQIENVTVWNLIDANNNYCGQAATFPQWTFLDS